MAEVDAYMFTVYDQNGNPIEIPVLIGPEGPAGPQGPTGVAGKDGAQGPRGQQGPQGSTGPQGDKGATGDVGPRGPAGKNGSVGPAGPVGPVGPQGPKGDTGKEGPPGTTTWEGITGKPATFRPSAHSHSLSAIYHETESAAGYVFPVDTGKISNTRSCRSAFLPPEGVTIEYSEDGGKTWLLYDADDDRKRDLTSMLNPSPFFFGGSNKKENITTNDMLRITYTALEPWYMSVDMAYIWVSTAGGTLWCLGEYNTKNAPDTWNHLMHSSDDGWVAVSGWGGCNELTFTNRVFGRSVPSYRFTFKATKVNTQYGSPTVSDLRLYGNNYYSGGSYMNRIDHLYGWDGYQNAIFPAGMSVNGDLTVNGMIKHHEPVWRKIADIVSDGAPIEMDIGKLQAICLKFPKENTVSDWFPCHLAMDGWVGTGNAAYLAIGLQSGKFKYCGAEIKHGAAESYQIANGTNEGTMNALDTTSYADKCVKIGKYFSRMYIGSSGKLCPAGTKFEVWGVDYVG